MSNVYEVEIPQLVLTSTVNLNGKGTIELDWPDYDIKNKYFVIYRKQEGEEMWKTIVTLDEKFNSNKYTDNLANDKISPTISNINMKGNSENNKIEISSTSTDTGIKYQYYIESYDINTNMLINSSKSQ
jgi:hypothetical protein